jgi:hypothetical protein
LHELLGFGWSLRAVYWMPHALLEQALRIEEIPLLIGKGARTSHVRQKKNLGFDRPFTWINVVVERPGVAT